MDDVDLAEYVGSKEETRDLRRMGYGRCKGCGGQEPLEVLRQMDGFCTSECERDHDG